MVDFAFVHFCTFARSYVTFTILVGLPTFSVSFCVYVRSFDFAFCVLPFVLVPRWSWIQFFFFFFFAHVCVLRSFYFVLRLRSFAILYPFRLRLILIPPFVVLRILLRFAAFAFVYHRSTTTVHYHLYRIILRLDSLRLRFTFWISTTVFFFFRFAFYVVLRRSRWSDWFAFVCVLRSRSSFVRSVCVLVLRSFSFAFLPTVAWILRSF